MLSTSSLKCDVQAWHNTSCVIGPVQNWKEGGLVLSLTIKVVTIIAFPFFPQLNHTLRSYSACDPSRQLYIFWCSTTQCNHPILMSLIFLTQKWNFVFVPNNFADFYPLYQIPPEFWYCPLSCLLSFLFICHPQFIFSTKFFVNTLNSIRPKWGISSGISPTFQLNVAWLRCDICSTNSVTR